MVEGSEPLGGDGDASRLSASPVESEGDGGFGAFESGKLQQGGLEFGGEGEGLPVPSEDDGGAGDGDEEDGWGLSGQDGEGDDENQDQDEEGEGDD